ncbi:MAG: cupin [Oceanospirillaceae bacterium]|nr:cupin [Oceanospirillaceae bacterium]
MKIIQAAKFTAKQAWDSQLIATMDGITTRIHWADAPYPWHTNTGQEVFVVLAGKVKMYYKLQGETLFCMLSVGDVFYASLGLEHSAHPQGEARILVVEAEFSQ